MISCEDPAAMPVAIRLAAAIEKSYGRNVRITRTAPRIGLGSRAIGHRSGNTYGLWEESDIILGNRDTSHTFGQFGTFGGSFGGHTAPLPFMCSSTFPGLGRSIICLTRPFAKEWSCGPPKPPLTVVEKPARQHLMLGASDTAGLAEAADAITKLLPARRESR